MAHDHEKITYGMNEVKELFDASVLTGTIVSVDTDNDKAHVNISGFGQINDVPIFYHCEGRNDTEGGAAAFSDGDNVYILNKEGKASPGVSDLQIVGFVDGLKFCGLFAYMDGRVNKRITGTIDGNPTWSDVRDAVSGSVVEQPFEIQLSIATSHRRDPWSGIETYAVTRAFLNFDLSSWSGLVKAVTLRIYGKGTKTSAVMVQQGTQGDHSLDLGDYTSFAGSSFANVIWQANDVANDFIFNESGIAYIQSVLGGKAKFCLRNRSYDYLNVDPNDGSISSIYDAHGHAICSEDRLMVEQLIITLE